MTQPLDTLQKTIKISFKNKELFENIFIHRSYLNEHRSFYLPSNEKLEFLGDSVLSLVTSIYLYRNFPHLEEGEYTDIKASIVRTESLAEVAQKIGLGDCVYLSKGEEQGKGRQNVNILADTFEALIAGIFIEHGFEKAFQFISEYLFKDKLDYIVKNKLYLSPKSHLQELVQASHRILPTYQIVQETGPEHKKVFEVTVSINEKIAGTGIGNSKKQAEEKAAQNALDKLQKIK